MRNVLNIILTLLIVLMYTNGYAGPSGSSITCDNNKRVCQVYLKEEFSEPHKYSATLRVLSRLDSSYTVYFHLKGFGGDLSIVKSFYDNMNTVKYKSVSIVEGNVYSAHALFAVMTEQLIVKPGTFLMFHKPFLVVKGREIHNINAYCKQQYPKQVAQCQSDYEARLAPAVRFAHQISLKLLTKAELDLVDAGGEVYIKSTDKRL